MDELPPAIRQDSVAAEQALHPWLREHLSNNHNQSHTDDGRHQKLQASYYGLMSEVDDNMGRLIAALKERGDWQNTIFIFTTDHGEQMGDHWMYGKAGFFDQSFHIPLIVYCPGVEPGHCYHCHTGRCPVGVATQDPKLRARLDPDEAAERVYNFLHTLTIEAQLFARACGKTNIHSLEPEDLAALTMEASAMAGVPLAGTNYTVGVEDYHHL